MLTEYDGELVYYTTQQLRPEDIKQPTPVTGKHPHICLLKLWVKDCDSSDTPHKWWMFRGCGGTTWHRCDEKTPMFVPDWEYKRVEPNCFVNGVEVPLGIETIEQFNELLSTNKQCSIWMPDVRYSSLVSWETITNLWRFPELGYLIKHRLMYTTKADAIKRAEAMIKWKNIK